MLLASTVPCFHPPWNTHWIGTLCYSWNTAFSSIFWLHMYIYHCKDFYCDLHYWSKNLIHNKCSLILQDPGKSSANYFSKIYFRYTVLPKVHITWQVFIIVALQIMLLTWLSVKDGVVLSLYAWLASHILPHETLLINSIIFLLNWKHMKKQNKFCFL